MIELLTLSNIEEFERITEQELSLIAFGIPWSSPCQHQHKILVNLMKRYRGIISIVRVDVEKYPELTQKGNIQSVPTLIVYKKGEEIKRLVGLQSFKTLHVLLAEMVTSGIQNAAGGIADKLPILPIIKMKDN